MSSDTSTKSEPGGPGSRVRKVGLWGPGFSVALVGYWLMVDTGVAPLEVAAYAAYWVFGLIVPGVLVLRWSRGRSAGLVEELSLGAVTGLCLEGVATLTANLLVVDQLAGWWVVVPYLALLHPRARAAARNHGWSREPVGQAWAMAGLACLLLIQRLPTLRSDLLPPLASTVNIDKWWHLGLAQEMLRPGMPTDPQVAGEPMIYHWLSHMHLAVASRLSGVDPVVVELRLWWVPLMVVLVGLIAVLARTVARRSWAGPVAVWASFLAVNGGVLWGAGRVVGPGGFTSSPSQIVSMAAIVAGSTMLVDLVRTRLKAGPVIWGLLIILVSVAMKPTAIPVMLGGLGVAGLMMLIRDRRIPWQTVGVGTVMTVTMVASLVVTESVGGKYTLFGSLHSMWPYSSLIADSPRGLSSGVLVDSLVGARAWFVALSTLVVGVVGNGLRFVGLAALGMRETRRDAAAWFLAGAYAAGWAVMLILDHSSRSQFYFMGAVAPLGSVLGVWVLVAVFDRAENPIMQADERWGVDRRWLVGLGLLAGAAIAWIARELPGALPAERIGLVDRVWFPFVAGVVGLAVVAIATARATAARQRRVAVGLVVVTAVFGMAIPGSLGNAVVRIGRVWEDPPVVNVDSIDYLTSEEQAAALWLREQAEPLDVVATNANCRPAQMTVPGCDARGFWLSGLSGLRVYLGGWGYTSRAHAQHGQGGVGASHQPPPWPDRFELSQRVFTDPDGEVVAELRDAGVDWLVGDRRAGDVSPELSNYADLEFENEVVSIWSVGG